MDIFKLLDETIVVIIEKDDRMSLRQFGDKVFSEEEKLELLSKIYNSPLSDNIDNVIIAQVNNDIDTYYIDKENKQIIKGGELFQTYFNLNSYNIIDNDLSDYIDFVIGNIEKILSNEFDDNEFSVYYDEDIIINFSEDFYDITEMSYGEKNNLKQRINNLLKGYKFSIDENYNTIDVRLTLPEPYIEKYIRIKMK